MLDRQSGTAQQGDRLGNVERPEEYPELPAELLALLRDPRVQPPITHVAVAKAEIEFLHQQLQGAVAEVAKLRAGISCARGLCTDKAPYLEIDAMLGRALDPPGGQ